MTPNATIVGYSSVTGPRAGGGVVRSAVVWPAGLLVPCRVAEFGLTKIAALQAQHIEASRSVTVPAAALAVLSGGGITPKIDDFVTLADRFGANPVVYAVRAVRTAAAAGRIGTADEIVLTLGKGGGA